MNPYNNNPFTEDTNEITSERDANRGLAEGARYHRDAIKTCNTHMRIHQERELKAEINNDAETMFYHLGYRHGLDTAKSIFILGE